MGSFTPYVVSPKRMEVSADHEGLMRLADRVGETDNLLLEQKAIVFRGFKVSRAEVDSVLELILPNRLPYIQGNSPRTKVGSNVYTSTEYPAEFTISMHNELSYANKWPTRLAFYCETPPAAGGETPLVDGTTWLSSLSPEVRGEFKKGVRYIQNLHSGLGFGRSWQDTFETADKATVEEYLGNADVDWEWRAEDALRITQIRPAVIRHPVTGNEVWFNQFDQWHLAGLDAETASVLLEVLAHDELPQSVTFADGSPIPDEYVAHVRQKGLESAVDVSWEAGDLLLVDNIAVAHGRRPYAGPRRILVAMSD